MDEPKKTAEPKDYTLREPRLWQAAIDNFMPINNLIETKEVDSLQDGMVYLRAYVEDLRAHEEIDYRDKQRQLRNQLASDTITASMAVPKTYERGVKLLRSVENYLVWLASFGELEKLFELTRKPDITPMWVASRELVYSTLREHHVFVKGDPRTSDFTKFVHSRKLTSLIYPKSAQE